MIYIEWWCVEMRKYYNKMTAKLIDILSVKRYAAMLLVSIVIILSTWMIIWMHTYETIEVVNETLIIRAMPSTLSSVVTKINQHDRLHILKKENGWARVRVNQQQEGWVPIWVLDNATLNHDSGLMVSVKEETPLYNTTQQNATVIATLTPDTSYELISDVAGWATIKYEQQQGYILSNQLNFDIKEVTSASESVINPETIDITNAEYLQVRASGQAFHEKPDLLSNPLYNPEYNQRFKYLSSVKGSDGTEFAYVEDSYGQKGYLEERIIAYEKFEENHASKPMANSIKGALIVIDAGHGGEDSGAISHDELVQEKELTLQTSMRLKKVLEEAGATVVMVRSDDKSVSLKDRRQLSNEQVADAFISLHFDESGTSVVRGITTYYYHKADEMLANFVNTELANITLFEDVRINNNGVLFGNYHVLRENERPSILLELGYMDNLEDLELIQLAEYHDAIAQAIVKGLTRYFPAAHETE